MSDIDEKKEKNEIDNEMGERPPVPPSTKLSGERSPVPSTKLSGERPPVPPSTKLSGDIPNVTSDSSSKTSEEIPPVAPSKSNPDASSGDATPSTKASEERPPVPPSTKASLGDATPSKSNPEASLGDAPPLEYGDIIQILSPLNQDTHEKVYYIHYIDEKLIHLLDVNSDTPDGDGKEYTLEIDEFRNIQDESIESILLLDRMQEKGFIRQNGIKSGNWLNIHFGGDIPSIVVCQVTNIEEDMLELKIYPSSETIYIDFKYQGIPRDLPITKLEIRNKPEDSSKLEDEEEEEVSESETKKIKQTKTKRVEESKYDDDTEDEDEDVDVDVEVEEEKDDEDYDDDEGFEIEFGEVLEPIKQVVEVSQERRKYNVNIQRDDLLNDVLASIPLYERNYRTMKDVMNIIDRYEELREIFSKYDKNRVITGIRKQKNKDNPIYELLKWKTDKPMPLWIVPVVNMARNYFRNLESNSDQIFPEQRFNQEKTYDINEDIGMLKNDIDTFFNPFISSMQENIMKTYNLPYESQYTITSHYNPSTTQFITETIKNQFSSSVGKKIRVMSEYMFYDGVFNKDESIPIQGYLTLPIDYIFKEASRRPVLNILLRTNLREKTNHLYNRHTLLNTELNKQIIDESELSLEKGISKKDEREYNRAVLEQFLNKKVNFHSMSGNLINNTDEMRTNVRAFLKRIVPKKQNMIRKVLSEYYRMNNEKSALNIESNRIYGVNAVCRNMMEICTLLDATIGVSNEEITMKDAKRLMKEVASYQENIVLLTEYTRGQSKQIQDLQVELDSILKSTMNRIHSMFQQKKDHEYMKELYEYEKDIGTRKIVTSETESFVNSLKYDQARTICSYVTHEDLSLYTDRNVRNILETKLNILKDNKKKTRKYESTIGYFGGGY